MSLRQRRERGDTTIVRIERSQPHVAIANATVRDINLSLQAVGLLAYILSMSGNWELGGIRGIRRHRGGRGSGKRWVAGRGGVGRDRVAATIAELRREGYCVVTQDRGADGRMGATIYTFREVRGDPDPAMSAAPRPGFPDAAKSGSVDQPLRILSIQNPNSQNRTTPKARASRRAAQPRVVRPDEDDDSALRALDGHADDLALALGVSRHAAQAWTLDMVRRAGSASTVRAALDRAMPRVRAGDAGGSPQRTRGYLETACLGRRTPASQRTTAGTAGAHASAIVAGLAHGREGG
jgi:hypothetical protein